MFHIGKKLGKENWFLLLGIFMPLVWIAWLALDHSTWNEGEGAPRTDTPVGPAAQPPVATPVAQPVQPQQTFGAPAEPAPQPPQQAPAQTQGENNTPPQQTPPAGPFVQ